MHRGRPLRRGIVRLLVILYLLGVVRLLLRGSTDILCERGRVVLTGRGPFHARKSVKDDRREHDGDYQVGDDDVRDVCMSLGMPFAIGYAGGGEDDGEDHEHEHEKRV